MKQVGGLIPEEDGQFSPGLFEMICWPLSLMSALPYVREGACFSMLYSIELITHTHELCSCVHPCQ